MACSVVHNDWCPFVRNFVQLHAFVLATDGHKRHISGQQDKRCNTWIYYWTSYSLLQNRLIKKMDPKNKIYDQREYTNKCK